MIRLVDQWSSSSNKLAELIEGGLFNSNTYEDILSYVRRKSDNNFGCCALGFALVGKFGKPEVADYLVDELYHNFDDETEIFSLIAQELGVPRELAMLVEEDHYTNKIKAVMIVERLRNDYYRKSDNKTDFQLDPIFADARLDEIPSSTDCLVH
jgi:hypothetical protein